VSGSAGRPSFRGWCGELNINGVKGEELMRKKMEELLGEK
jgi:hypothetical protein